MFDNLEA